MNTAKLSVVLKADDVVVAQSDDPILWQRLLGVIQGQQDLSGPPPAHAAIPATSPIGAAAVTGAADGPLQRFARELKLDAAIVEGALAPSPAAPYITLNPHNWEAFKKAVPARGKTSVASAALAGTILALWMRASGSGIHATQALAADVLATIGQRDPNSSRSIKNAEWIQTRAGGSFIVNPAKTSYALELVRAFCEMRAPSAES